MKIKKALAKKQILCESLFMEKISVRINIEATIEIGQLKFDLVMKEIIKLLKLTAQQIFSSIAVEINRALPELIGTKGINVRCGKCGARRGFTKRGFRKDGRKIKTSIAVMIFPSLQMMECPNCGHRFSPLLQILGIEKYQRASSELMKKTIEAAINLPYRLARRVVTACTGAAISVHAIWKEIQKRGPMVKEGIADDEEALFGGDGTGIPIRGAGKRGKELKIIAQHKKQGGLRIIGIGIGEYKKDWDFAKKICADIKKKFKISLFCGDGGVYIELKNYLKGILFQRDLWHIHHSLKHVLWSEGIKRSSEEYKEIVGKAFGIVKLPKNLNHEDINYKKIKEKIKRLNFLIDRCVGFGYFKVADYLEEAKNCLFTFADKRLKSRKLMKTNSLVERVMREVNFRADVACAWSDRGILNIMKLRLAVVYNNLDLDTLYVKEIGGEKRRYCG